MSKEEILQREVKPMSIAGGIFTYRDQDITERVKRAMNQYAKQEAIDFLKFYEGQELVKLKREQPFQTLVPIPTIEQFYDLYIQSKEGK